MGIEPWRHTKKQMKILDNLGVFLPDWKGHHHRWIVKGHHPDSRLSSVKSNLDLAVLTQCAVAAASAVADIESWTCLLISVIFLLLLTNYESDHIKGQRGAHVERSWYILFRFRKKMISGQSFSEKKFRFSVKT